MIDVYQHGSNIGISLHGWGGFLLITYFVLEMVFLFLTKSLLIHKLFIWFRVRREVKKLIPKWWKLDKVNVLTIERVNTRYKVYVQLRSRLMVSDWTNDHIIVDWLGSIKNQKLIEGIKYYDDRKSDEIKRWKRDNILEKIL
jgi:hypothetical protein